MIYSPRYHKESLKQENTREPNGEQNKTKQWIKHNLKKKKDISMTTWKSNKCKVRQE